MNFQTTYMQWHWHQALLFSILAVKKQWYKLLVKKKSVDGYFINIIVFEIFKRYLCYILKMFLSLCILLFNMLLCNKFKIFQVNIPLLLFRLNCLFEISSSTVNIFPCYALLWFFRAIAWLIHDTRETHDKNA